MSPATILRGLQTQPQTMRGMCWVTGATLFFVSMHAAIRHLSGEMHPFEIAFFRNVFGLVIFLPWLARRGLRVLRTERFGLHALRGTIHSGSMLCWFTALSLLPLADATALALTAPLIVALGAMVFLRELVRPARWLALGAGALGAVIIVRPGFEAFNIGILFVFGSGICVSASKLMAKSLTRTDSSGTIVAYMTLTMSVVTVFPALFVWTWPGLEQLAILAAAGGLGTLGHLMTTRAYSLADVTAVEPFSFFRLIWAALIGYFVFFETPDAATWAGGAVIVMATSYLARLEAQGARAAAAVAQ